MLLQLTIGQLIELYENLLKIKSCKSVYINQVKFVDIKVVSGRINTLSYMHFENIDWLCIDHLAVSNLHLRGRNTKSLLGGMIFVKVKDNAQSLL